MRGLRFALVLLALLAGCAATPKPAPEKPQPLKDHTADSDYNLEPVKAKLQQAAGFEREGNRTIAAAVVDTARKMLPAESTRERAYLQVVKAGIWAREGEKRDAAKARALLEEVEKSAKAGGDARLLADVNLARVLLELGDGDKTGAVKNADAALRELAAVGAQAKLVETARDLAYQFLDAGDPANATAFATRAYDTAARLDDDELLLQTCTDVARVSLVTGGDAEGYFRKAYEASYRLKDLAWRNVVIAAAVDGYFAQGGMRSCVDWGDRMRERNDGAFPDLETSGLWPEDYITALSQYALASDKLKLPGPRARDAAQLAVRAIDGLDEEQQAGWNELKEKLNSGLLQKPREK